MLVCPRKEHPRNLTLKAWDKDVLTLSSEYIGSHERSLHDMCAEAFLRMSKLKQRSAKLAAADPQELHLLARSYDPPHRHEKGGGGRGGLRAWTRI